MTKALRYWLPLAAWMVLIYVLSDRSDIPGVQNGILDLVFKKAMHATGYAVLAWLWWRALTAAGVGRAAPWAFVLTIAYAVTDEWHQTWVVGRTGRATDVLIDAVGAAVALRLATRGVKAPTRDGPRL
ncbi:MAG: VanZ family protein [Anaerolineae bacterium]